MDIFLYIIIFIMGTVFGSFYTLAVYRIPKKIDITHTHSFCPNCKHKLGFFELIPVWSYLLLGGKCKECKQKIRPRYLIIEICSGIAFVLIAIASKLDISNIPTANVVERSEYDNLHNLAKSWLEEKKELERANAELRSKIDKSIEEIENYDVKTNFDNYLEIFQFGVTKGLGLASEIFKKNIGE